MSSNDFTQVHDQETSSFQGFLQKTDAGTWVLCDAPNIKSCCLKHHTTINLDGEFSNYSTKSAVTIQGVYHKDSNHISAISISETNSFPYYSLGAVCLALCLWLILRKVRPLLP